MIVGWSEYAVAVQVAQVDGRILPPPEPEEDSSDAAAGGGVSQATSMVEQLDYFNGLNPEKLGAGGRHLLPGDHGVLDGCG